MEQDSMMKQDREMEQDSIMKQDREWNRTKRWKINQRDRTHINFLEELVVQYCHLLSYRLCTEVHDG